jgi:uncharacterized protein (TIGR03435 family)
MKAIPTPHCFVFAFVSVLLFSAWVEAQSSQASRELASITLNHSGDRMSRIGMMPDSLTLTNVSAKFLIKYAYGFQDYQFVGAPTWIDSERYDIQLKIPEASLGIRSVEQLQQARRAMVQALLTDRFHLSLRGETREGPTFALLLSEGGSQLTDLGNVLGHSQIYVMHGDLNMTSMRLNALTNELSEQLRTKVSDETGLNGTYDVSLHWAEENASGSDMRPNVESIKTALREQTGLELQPQNGFVDMVVIEAIDRPIVPLM